MLWAMFASPQIRSALVLLAAAISLAACGGGGGSAPRADTTGSGDIPDSQAYISFSPSSGAYTLKVPEGWARTGADTPVSFSSHYNNVRVETQPAPQAPTVASATSSEVPSLSTGAPGFSLGDVATVHRPSGDAIRVRYQAQSPADQVTGRSVKLECERYEFWRAGVEAVVTVSSPVGADNTDPWRTITDSFAWR
jgi:hypothetical protein